MQIVSCIVALSTTAVMRDLRRCSFSMH